MPNWCSNSTLITGSQTEISQLANIIITKDGENETVKITNLLPQPTDVEPTVQWQWENWGIKWGDCDSYITDQKDDALSLTYETPWGPFEPHFWQKVSQQFPSLVFSTTFDEGGMCFHGVMAIRNGEVLYEETREYPDLPDDFDWNDPEQDESRQQQLWDIMDQMTSDMDAVV